MTFKHYIIVFVYFLLLSCGDGVEVSSLSLSDPTIRGQWELNQLEISFQDGTPVDVEFSEYTLTIQSGQITVVTNPATSFLSQRDLATKMDTTEFNASDIMELNQLITELTCNESCFADDTATAHYILTQPSFGGLINTISSENFVLTMHFER